jgi:hypothetical protein
VVACNIREFALINSLRLIKTLQAILLSTESMDTDERFLHEVAN